MKVIIVFFVMTIIVQISYASTLLTLKGKVLKIEKGYVHIQSSSETIKVSMKNLSKSQSKMIQTSQGSAKEVTLEVLPEAILKE